jgi:hypothetical protein
MERALGPRLPGGEAGRQRRGDDQAARAIHVLLLFFSSLGAL